MQRRDRGLHLVGAGCPERQCGVEEPGPLGDHPPVPARPVLLGQGHRAAVGVQAGRRTGMVQQHQGEQAGRLRVGGQQPVQ